MKYYKHIKGNIWQVNGKRERRIYIGNIAYNFNMKWQRATNTYHHSTYTEITEEEVFLEML